MEKTTIKRSMQMFGMMILFGFCCTFCGRAEAADLDVKAESAILMDEMGTVLYEKNAHLPLPPASVTKSMTLLLAVEAVEAGRVQLSEEVSVSEAAARQGGSQIWLKPGEKMTFHELLIAIGVVSANDAALAVMENLYGNETEAVEAMNRRAQELGLKNTHFSNVNGLPVANHTMSAYDTALIVKEAARHPLYMEICSIKEYWLRGGKNWLVNTNKLLWWYDGADGLKTGWTQEAKHCFAGTAKRNGMRLIAVVFAAPEPRGHFKETMKLMDWGFANFEATPIVEKDEIISTAQVENGMLPEIPLIAKAGLTVVERKGLRGEVEREINLKEPLDAPIEKNACLGELIVRKNGEVLGSVPILAGEKVEEKMFQDTLVGLVRRFFGTISR